MHSFLRPPLLVVTVLLVVHLSSIESLNWHLNREIKAIAHSNRTISIGQNTLRVRRGSSNPPTGRIEIKILIAQVNQMKVQVSQLQNSSHGDKYRIATLETDLEDAMNALDDANRDIEQKAERLMQLLQLVKNLQSQLIHMQYNFQEIVETIENRSFVIAEDKFEQISRNGGGESIIPEIINMVFNGNAEKFDLLIDFTKNLQSSELRSIFYDCFTDLVLDMMTNDVLSQYLVQRMKPTVFEMMEKIHKANASASNAIVDQLVDRVYIGTHSYNVLNYIVQLPHAEQQVAGLMAFFDEIKQNDGFCLAGTLASNPVIDFAFYIRYVREQTPITRNRLNALKSQLPKSASALAFADSVCIKSKSKDKYVYANFSKYDGNRRKVFVLKPSGVETSGHWHVESDGSIGVEGFRFKNAYYNGYLSAFDSTNDFRVTTVGETLDNKRDSSNVHWPILYFPDDSVQMLHRYQYMTVVQGYDRDRYDIAMGIYPFSDPNSRWFIEEC